MKKAIIFTLFAFASASLFAQGKNASSELSIGVDAGLPTGNFNSGYNFGIGATAKYAYNFTEMMAVTFQAGYISFGGKTISDGLGGNYKNPSAGFIPFKAGYRYTLSGGIYFEPQIGFTSVSSGGVSSTGFTYAINAGYRMQKGIDIALRYETVSESGGSLAFIGLRVAYSFTLGGK